MTDTRKPTSFLNYRGDLTESFDMGRAYGPNLLGEMLHPVTAEYDADADRTRIGFSLLAPERAA